jgi:hypothetical protein
MEAPAMSSRAVHLLPALFVGAVASWSLLAPPAHSDTPTADAVKDLQPRAVTIQEKGIPLSKALKLFAEQTGVGVLPAEDDPKINLSLNKVSFWKALDEIAKEADMRVYPYLREGKLSLMKGYREVPTSYSGPFRVVLKRVTMTRDLETDAHFGAATVEVAWPPPFQAFLMETQPSNYVVQDDAGTNLNLPRFGKGHAPVFGRNAVTLDSIPLPAPGRGVKNFGLIKGNLSVIGSAKMLSFVFDEIKKGKEFTQEGVTAKLDDVDAKPKSDLWAVQVHLKYPPSGVKLESFQVQSWLVGNQAFLVKRNQRLGHANVESSEAPADQALITYRFAEDDDAKVKLGTPAEWKLEYRTPSPVVEVAIPFEFKDVPLP